MIENEVKYNTGKWLLNTLHNSEYIGTWDKERKVVTRNVGGWQTSEYPINRVEIIEVFKSQLIDYKEDETDEKVKVIALIETPEEEYASKECISLGQLIEFIKSSDENYLIGSITEKGLKGQGWFCKIIGMHDASPSSNHDCDNKEVRIIYGENIFRLWI